MNECIVILNMKFEKHKCDIEQIDETGIRVKLLIKSA
jgi:hypothetical protein